MVTRLQPIKWYTHDIPSVLVWVCLLHLSLHCWSNDALCWIGNNLGKYKDKAEPRENMFSCARICFEVDFEKWPSEAVMILLNNWKHLKQLDYEKLPFKWKSCHKYDHTCFDLSWDTGFSESFIQLWLSKRITVGSNIFPNIPARTFRSHTRVMSFHTKCNILSLCGPKNPQKFSSCYTKIPWQIPNWRSTQMFPSCPLCSMLNQN